MKLKMYSIYDSKAESFANPFVMRSNGEALRGFIDLANDPQTDIAKHPEDFTLFHLGEWESDTATITPEMTPRSLGVAIEFSKKNPQLSILNKETVQS